MSSSTPPLYKFADYGSDPKYRDRVKRTLLEGPIHFSRPPEFNDPFEARPQFVRADNFVERFKRFAMRVSKGPRNERRKLASNMTQHAAASPTFITSLREKQRHDLATQTAVYSMAAVYDDPLLWAHYAAKHGGVCIHLDHTRPPFGVALPVKYDDEYPTIDVPNELTPDGIFERCLLTKSKHWEYEQEYRLCRIDFAPGISGTLGLEWEDQTAIVPIDRFRGVTLGARMDPHDRDELIALAKGRSTPLEVWQAKLHDTRYEFFFDRIL